MSLTERFSWKRLYVGTRRLPIRSDRIDDGPARESLFARDNYSQLLSAAALLLFSTASETVCHFRGDTEQMAAQGWERATYPIYTLYIRTTHTCLNLRERHETLRSVICMHEDRT